MRFSLVYFGTINSRRNSSAIRSSRKLQEQLKALEEVVSQHLPTGQFKRSIEIDGVLYKSIIPMRWTCEVDIRFVRATSSGGVAGSPDLDNSLKPLFDALSAPSHPTTHGTVPQTAKKVCYLAVLDDKQIIRHSVQVDHYWGADPGEDITMVTFTTKETDFDVAVAIGGESFADLRKGVI